MKRHISKKFLVQFAQCNPPRRGRPLSSTAAAKMPKKEVCTQKRKSDGATVTYRTHAAGAAHKERTTAKKVEIQKRRDAGEKVRGRKPKLKPEAKAKLDQARKRYANGKKATTTRKPTAAKPRTPRTRPENKKAIKKEKTLSTPAPEKPRITGSPIAKANIAAESNVRSLLPAAGGSISALARKLPQGMGPGQMHDVLRAMAKRGEIQLSITHQPITELSRQMPQRAIMLGEQNGMPVAYDGFSSTGKQGTSATADASYDASWKKNVAETTRVKLRPHLEFETTIANLYNEVKKSHPELGPGQFNDLLWDMSKNNEAVLGRPEMPFSELLKETPPENIIMSGDIMFYRIRRPGR